MEIVRTIVCKLDPTPEQVREIDATLVAFAAACDHIALVSRREQTTNKVILQHACYREVRETFGLSANLTVRGIARVCAALKVKEKALSTFDPTSIDYDARIFSFRQKDWTFSLTLLNSRQRLASKLGNRQREALKGRHPTSATLVKRRDGRYFLHIQVTNEAPQPVPTTGTLGVDLGRRRVAVDSDGNIHEATEVNRLREHYPKVRRSVQRKGTKASRRLLKRLSGRERKHASHINHVISRRIVDLALSTARDIALEDLAGIRKRTRVRKAQRYRQQSWSFFQLRQFIAYKALQVGVLVVFIDPAYTSQRCHVCSELGHRHGLLFSCTRHGDFDADLNGARNIALAGAAVTQPEHSDALARA